MTTIVFLHSPATSPFTWRQVADYLPPAWAVAAPDLRACTSAAEMDAAIARDLQAVSDEQAVLVAEGAGAIPALHFAQAYPELVAGVIVSAAQLSWSRLNTLGARATHRKATREAGPMMTALRGVTVDGQVVAASGVPGVALRPEKTPGQVPAAFDSKTIAEASADWYEYAPDAFAANIVQVIASWAEES
ncbi:MAG: alpha/beta hydrolase [Actinomycetaceae bacterium]|nr:alpha/beta hydrolase [Actinomycetaceae bacterium]